MKIIFNIGIFFVVFGNSFLYSQFDSAKIISNEQNRIAEYSYIDASKCTINNAQIGLSYFYEKLIQLENREIDNINVYHIGDSHVSIRILTTELARNLQLNFGFAGEKFFLTESPPKKKQPRRKTTKKKASILEEKKSDIKLYTTPGQNDQSYDYLDKKRGLKYYSFGVSGKTFAYFLNSRLVVNHLNDINPDLVIITLGTNDSYGLKYDKEKNKAEISDLIDLIRLNPGTGNVSILLVTPPDCYYKKRNANPFVKDVQQIMMELADEKGIAVFDFFTVMGGLGSIKKWQQDGLALRDLVHLSEKGYALQAELLNFALMFEYQRRVFQ